MQEKKNPISPIPMPCVFLFLCVVSLLKDPNTLPTSLAICKIYPFIHEHHKRFHLGFPVIGKTHFSLKLPMHFWEGFCMRLSPYSILYFVFFIVCFVFAYCPNSTLPKLLAIHF